MNMHRMESLAPGGDTETAEALRGARVFGVALRLAATELDLDLYKGTISDRMAALASAQDAVLDGDAPYICMALDEVYGPVHGPGGQPE